MKTNLSEISIIRPFLIVLLVLYHSFAPWAGAWIPFDGYEESMIYFWIAKTSYSFMLPMFVFISGYIWSFQREDLEIIDGIKQLIRKKFKRLYIPALIFGLLYYLVFNFNDLQNVTFDDCFQILGGYAHLWFLPMLFWCFVISWCILRIKREYVRWTIIIVLESISFLDIPLGISVSFSYLFYFYLGYSIYKKKNLISGLTLMHCCVLFFAYIALFVLCIVYGDSIRDNFAQDGSIHKLIGWELLNITRLVYATLAIIAILLLSIILTKKIDVSKSIMTIGNYCFGVYIFQQFILKFMYYKMDICSYIGPFMLPWIGFLGATVCSLALSIIVKSTKVGNKLL